MNKQDLQNELGKWLTNSTASIDDFLDVHWRRLKTRFGWNGVPKIQPYIGYANDDRAWFHGRVLTNPPQEMPSEDDNWWDNLLQMYRRFESDEVPGVKVEIEFGGDKHYVTSDHEGYFHLEAPHSPEACGCQNWTQVAMRIVEHPNVTSDESATMAKMLTPSTDAQFGVISDIDDTVLHTGITDLRAAIRLTFFHNARTRKPLPGVAGLYHALQQGTANPSGKDSDCDRNPLFYVSSSPWNLFDLLEDFLELNDIPDGPILLRDLGFDKNKFLKQGHEHKLEKAQRIMAAFPHLPFVLIGDSGQEDARLYAEAARTNPEQIKAIFIRDVDPDIDTDLDASVQQSIDIAAKFDVPMFLVSTSATAATAAYELGLITSHAHERVMQDTQRDLERETTA